MLYPSEVNVPRSLLQFPPPLLASKVLLIVSVPALKMPPPKPPGPELPEIVQLLCGFPRQR